MLKYYMFETLKASNNGIDGFLEGETNDFFILSGARRYDRSTLTPMDCLLYVNKSQVRIYYEIPSPKDSIK